MTYAFVEKGSIVEYPINEGDIMLKFPNTSFAIPFVPPTGYEFVSETPLPTCSETQFIVEGEPVFKNGKWTKTWIVENHSEERIIEITSNKAQAIRLQRDRLLLACDWTQLPDSSVDSNQWTAYRQALRDITEQSGFPFDVNWPEAPGS